MDKQIISQQTYIRKLLLQFPDNSTFIILVLALCAVLEHNLRLDQVELVREVDSKYTVEIQQTVVDTVERPYQRQTGLCFSR